MKNDDFNYWLLAGIIIFLFSFVLGMISCSKSTYVMPDGTMVELPHAPADSVGGSGR